MHPRDYLHRAPAKHYPSCLIYRTAHDTLINPSKQSGPFHIRWLPGRLILPVHSGHTDYQLSCSCEYLIACRIYLIPACQTRQATKARVPISLRYVLSYYINSTLVDVLTMRFTSFLLLLPSSSAILIPAILRHPSHNSTTSFNLPDPYDYSLGGDPRAFFEVYGYRNPLPERDARQCVIDATVATIVPAAHQERMGTQKRRYESGSVYLVFLPDERMKWNLWVDILRGPLWAFAGAELGREFQFFVIVEGQEGHLGNGWLWADGARQSPSSAQ